MRLFETTWLYTHHRERSDTGSSAVTLAFHTRGHSTPDGAGGYSFVFDHYSVGISSSEGSTYSYSGFVSPGCHAHPEGGHGEGGKLGVHCEGSPWACPLWSGHGTPASDPYSQTTWLYTHHRERSDTGSSAVTLAFHTRGHSTPDGSGGYSFVFDHYSVGISSSEGSTYSYSGFVSLLDQVSYTAPVGPYADSSNYSSFEWSKSRVRSGSESESIAGSTSGATFQYSSYSKNNTRDDDTVFEGYRYFDSTGPLGSGISRQALIYDETLAYDYTASTSNYTVSIDYTAPWTLSQSSSFLGTSSTSGTITKNEDDSGEDEKEVPAPVEVVGNFDGAKTPEYYGLGAGVMASSIGNANDAEYDSIHDELLGNDGESYEPSPFGGDDLQEKEAPKYRWKKETLNGMNGSKTTWVKEPIPAPSKPMTMNDANGISQGFIYALLDRLWREVAPPGMTFIPQPVNPGSGIRGGIANAPKQSLPEVKPSDLLPAPTAERADGFKQGYNYTNLGWSAAETVLAVRGLFSFIKSLRNPFKSNGAATASANGSAGAAGPGGAATPPSSGVVQPTVPPKLPVAPRSTPSLREQYLGRTPGKGSRTGRQVIERMETEGNLRWNASGGAEVRYVDPITKAESWHPLNSTDMGHLHDAVKYWNETGRALGPKHPDVRRWMLDPANYELQPSSINRANGAKLIDRFKPLLGDQ